MRSETTYFGLTLNKDGSDFIRGENLHAINVDSYNILVITWLENFNTHHRIQAQAIRIDDATTWAVGDRFTVLSTTRDDRPLIPFPTGHRHFVLPVRAVYGYGTPLAYVMKVDPDDLSITTVETIVDEDSYEARPSGFGTNNDQSPGVLIWDTQMAYIYTNGEDVTVDTHPISGAWSSLRDSLTSGYVYYGEDFLEWMPENLYTADGNVWEINSASHSIENSRYVYLHNRSESLDQGGVAENSATGEISYLYKHSTDDSYIIARANYAGDVVSVMGNINYTAYEDNYYEFTDNDHLLGLNDGTWLMLLDRYLLHTNIVSGEYDEDRFYGAFTQPVGSAVLTADNHVDAYPVVIWATNDIIYITIRSQFGWPPGGDGGEEPEHPEGPLWAVPGDWIYDCSGSYQEWYWMSAYVWDGSKWQACRMTDGELWWDGPDYDPYGSE